MLKLFLVILLNFPALVSAESCFPLFEKMAQHIQEKDGYTTTVGGQVYVHNGQLGYWPGLKVQADIDNWAEDLVNAIKWGPYLYSMRSDDPRKEWLESFRKSISDECKLSKGDYTKLRSMLKDLMEDGSFCPQGKILSPGLLGNKGDFKKVLKQAVKDQRFSGICQNESVKDDSFRDVKDVEKSDKKPSRKSSATKQ